MIAISLEMNSKGLVLSKKKKKEKKFVARCSLPLWNISSRSRATTATDKKGWYTCKLSCCFVNLNLYVVHGLFCRHCICLSSLLFEGPPTTSVLRVVQRLEILSLTGSRSILFSGTYLSGSQTPIGPVAGHYKNPILPFGLGLNFLLFFRQRFLK